MMRNDKLPKTSFQRSLTPAGFGPLSSGTMGPELGRTVTVLTH